MHYSAMRHAQLFFKTYYPIPSQPKILEIGSQDVNGSIRSVAPEASPYIGADFVAAEGVDIVLSDPYALPFEDASFDACVSSSCFEHSDFFWLAFNEVMRVLKPDGLFYMNVPSNAMFHRYPVDSWRFYPDAGGSLERWAKRSGYNAALLESFTGTQQRNIWNDYVAVFVRDEAHVDRHPRRILDSYKDFTNGMMRGREEILQRSKTTEDCRRVAQLTAELKSLKPS